MAGSWLRRRPAQAYLQRDARPLRLADRRCKGSAGFLEYAPAAYPEERDGRCAGTAPDAQGWIADWRDGRVPAETPYLSDCTRSILRTGQKRARPVAGFPGQR